MSGLFAFSPEVVVLGLVQLVHSVPVPFFFFHCFQWSYSRYRFSKGAKKRGRKEKREQDLVYGESLAGEAREDEASVVDLLVVVAAQSLLLLGGPGADGDADVAVGVLAADHEADLAGWVCRDRGVGVVHHGEDFKAGLLEGSDQG